MFKFKQWMVRNSMVYNRAKIRPSLMYYMAHRHSNKMANHRQKFEVLKNFPYKFENNRTIIKPINEFVRDESHVLAELNDKLYDDELNLCEGFEFAYLALLKMLTEHAHRALTGIVERTLRKDITEELAEIVYENIGLKVENEDNYSMKIDIVDFSYHLGADINRENNRNLRVKKYTLGNSWFSGQERTRMNIYLAENLEFGKHFIFNIEVLVRFITNLKLNAY